MTLPDRRRVMALLAGAVLLPQPAGAAKAAAPFAALADGVTAVRGDAEGRVHRLALQDGAKPAAIAAHRGAVTCLLALPGGRFVSGGADGRVRLWRGQGEGTEGDLVAGPGPVTALPYGGEPGLAVGLADGTIALWPSSSPGGNAPMRWRAHGRAVTGLALASDGSVTSGSADALIRRSGPGAGQIVTLAETEGPVRHLVAAPDGDTVAAFGFGEIAVYSAAGHERLSMRVFDAPAAALAISSDGEWIAALDGTGRAFVFDRLGGRPYWSDPAGAGGSEAIAFHPDSLRLVCLQRDGGIRLRDVRTGA